VTPTFVWDASALHHALIADRFDVLGDLAAGPRRAPWRNVTTTTVLHELRRNGLNPDGSWLSAVSVEELDELRALFEWAKRLDAGDRNIGEATVCAWAEVHDATAVLDDGDARRVGRAHGLPVHGSLWVVAEAVNSGRLALASAAGLVGELVAHGARYPCRSEGFTAWALRVGLVRA
jgi:predicted nucleic acid-binding protein